MTAWPSAKRSRTTAVNALFTKKSNNPNVVQGGASVRSQRIEPLPKEPPFLAGCIQAVSVIHSEVAGLALQHFAHGLECGQANCLGLSGGELVGDCAGVHMIPLPTLATDRLVPRKTLAMTPLPPGTIALTFIRWTALGQSWDWGYGEAVQPRLGPLWSPPFAGAWPGGAVCGWLSSPAPRPGRRFIGSRPGAAWWLWLSSPNPQPGRGGSAAAGVVPSSGRRATAAHSASLRKNINFTPKARSEFPTCRSNHAVRRRVPRSRLIEAPDVERSRVPLRVARRHFGGRGPLGWCPRMPVS